MNIKQAKRELFGKSTTYEDLGTFACIVKDKELIEEINAMKISSVHFDPLEENDENVKALDTDQDFIYHGICSLVLDMDWVSEDIKSEIRGLNEEYWEFVKDYEDGLRKMGLTPDPLDTDSMWVSKKVREQSR